MIEQELAEKASRIVDRINFINKKIYIRKPIIPMEPKEPKKPYISKLTKPSFFNLPEFILPG